MVKIKKIFKNLNIIKIVHCEIAQNMTIDQNNTKYINKNYYTMNSKKNYKTEFHKNVKENTNRCVKFRSNKDCCY